MNLKYLKNSLSISLILNLVFTILIYGAGIIFSSYPVTLSYSLAGGCLIVQVLFILVTLDKPHNYKLLLRLIAIVICTFIIFDTEFDRYINSSYIHFLVSLVIVSSAHIGIAASIGSMGKLEKRTA
jgi:hypothetical protein